MYLSLKFGCFNHMLIVLHSYYNFTTPIQRYSAFCYEFENSHTYSFKQFYFFQLLCLLDVNKILPLRFTDLLMTMVLLFPASCKAFCETDKRQLLFSYLNNVTTFISLTNAIASLHLHQYNPSRQEDLKWKLNIMYKVNKNNIFTQQLF